MIEVIGKDTSKYLQLTCWKCASILKYTVRDTFKREVNHDYLGDFDTIRAITCPVCSEVIKA